MQSLIGVQTILIFVKIQGQYSINVLLQKPAIQSADHNQWKAYMAVDGNHDPIVNDNHCSHSADGPGMPNWLVVDMQNYYLINYVDVWNREQCCAERLDYFIIGLTNQNYFPVGSNVTRGSYPLCGQYPSVAQLSARHRVWCDTGIPAYRYVIIQQPANGQGSITVCEIEAYPVLG